MILFDEATHRPLGVLVFGGSVRLELMADGCPAKGCLEKSCNFWHASLGSLHSDLVRATGTRRLMHLDRVDELRELVRGVSKLLNQPVYQLGDRQVAQMAALIDRNNKFGMSMSRAAYAQMLIRED